MLVNILIASDNMSIERRRTKTSRLRVELSIYGRLTEGTPILGQPTVPNSIDRQRVKSFTNVEKMLQVTPT